MIEELERRLLNHQEDPNDLVASSVLAHAMRRHSRKIVTALKAARRYQMLTAMGATRTAKNAARAGLFAALDELERGE